MATLSPFGLPESVYRVEATVALTGVLVHWMLYGVLLCQICLYYTAFPNDHRLLKQTVLLALVLETVQTILFTQHVFREFTRGFDDFLVAFKVGTLWFSMALMTGLIALLTQMFYCYRVAILTKSKYAVAAIAVLSIAQLGAAIATALQARAAILIMNILGTKISLITIGIWAATTAGCDTTITIIMVYYFKKLDTGYQETHNVVKRLIRLTIETGLFTALFSIITMALAYIPQNPPYYQVGILILAKMYSNSMIAALNSRIKLVSNSPSGFPPSWNESVEPTESWQVNCTHDIVFRRLDESVSTGTIGEVA